MVTSVLVTNKAEIKGREVMRGELCDFKQSSEKVSPERRYFSKDLKEMSGGRMLQTDPQMQRY